MNVRTLVDAINNGAKVDSSFIKIPSQTTTAYWWFDTSMAFGSPPVNLFPGNELTSTISVGGLYSGSYDGIYHGPNVSPSQKVLYQLGLTTTNANMVGIFKLLDYVMWYPFINLETPTVQTFVNNVTLPRYTTGAGVIPMLVCQQATLGGGAFTFNYIDQDGIAATSPINYYTVSACPQGSIATYQPAQVGNLGPFLQLAYGDTGIRSITSFTNVGGLGGAGGLGALVLVNPLCDTAIREINTTTELSFINEHSMPPVILDGAYLNFIVNCAGSLAATSFTGYANFAWV